ncbi:MAG: BamA/TamA family outer membrane protein [Colwellia sp.]|nr:BamA/TamA family outer membrane protein [Colwellia sp.]
MNISKLTTSIFILSLFASKSFASSNQFIDILDGQFDASQYLSENAYGFLPVPIIITDPAVDGGLGMMGLFFHEEEKEKNARLAAMQKIDNDDAAASLMPPSISALIGAYTGNNSYFAGGGHMGFFKKGTIRYMGGGGYGDINLDFYGSGDIVLNKPIQLNTKAMAVMQTIKFKIANSSFYLGPTHRYINADISPANLDDLIGNLPPEWQESLTDLLTKKITTSGAGFTLEYDTRNNLFSPKTGLKYELSHLWFDDAIGSDINYQLTEFTGLHYFQVAKKWRTAFRAEVEYANSDQLLPPYATPSISMRGIPAGRYQGNAIGLTELEVIYEINHRWEINVFAGVGKASSEFSSLLDSESKVSQGIGFRYLIARRYGFNMGIDIAKGPEENVFYIQAGSAW